jgi:hypothetical protein
MISLSPFGNDLIVRIVTDTVNLPLISHGFLFFLPDELGADVIRLRKSFMFSQESIQVSVDFVSTIFLTAPTLQL